MGTPIDPRVRFWLKVDTAGQDPTACWNWTANRDKVGYGRFQTSGPPNSVNSKAHRYAYEHLVGPIPEGLQLDHLCRNPSCVNPAHLEPVTAQENVRRAMAFLPYRTHCPKGHPYEGDNLYINPRPPGRRPSLICRTCLREAGRRHDAQRRQPVERPPKTHCKNGHEFTPENTRVRPGSQGRECLACRREISRRSAARRRSA